jgi:hypothetical protein
MSVEAKMVRRETGGDKPSLDQKLLPITGTKVLVCGEGRALARVLMESDQSEKTWLSYHSVRTSPRTGSVHRQLLPGCCYGSQASQWKKLEEGAPALCRSFLN